MSAKRGMLIVFEGNDRVGKSTQAHKLVEWLQEQGKPAQLCQFPDRSTPIGSLINQYLLGEQKMHNHAIHLLFTANRWEKYDEMLAALKAGQTLVVDRYSYSGVAYTASKEGADYEWCRGPETGLLKPDCLIFLSSDIKMLQGRDNFGTEVYETSQFQASVRDVYLKMKDSSWNVVDANNRTIEDVHQDIVQVVQNKYRELPDQIARLW